MKTAEVPIKSPCDADWTTMNPRATGRFCGDCKKVVHDLSSMNESDARKRIAAAPDGLCIRYLHDEHGNVWFKDTKIVSPLSLLKKRASLAALALMPMLTACMGAMDDQPLAPSEVEPPEAPAAIDGPDAAPGARTTAKPVLEHDAGPDGAPNPSPPH